MTETMNARILIEGLVGKPTVYKTKERSRHLMRCSGIEWNSQVPLRNKSASLLKEQH